MNTRRLIAVVALSAATAFSARTTPLLPSVDAAQNQPEILWDRWGVPHIFAPDLDQAMYAFGWAQMQSHGDLVLRLYGQARGRGAEYWGAEYLDSDRWVRTMACLHAAPRGKNNRHLKPHAS